MTYYAKHNILCDIPGIIYLVEHPCINGVFHWRCKCYKPCTHDRLWHSGFIKQQLKLRLKTYFQISANKYLQALVKQRCEISSLASAHIVWDSENYTITLLGWDFISWVVSLIRRLSWSPRMCICPVGYCADYLADWIRFSSASSSSSMQKKMTITENDWVGSDTNKRFLRQ